MSECTEQDVIEQLAGIFKGKISKTRTPSPNHPEAVGWFMLVPMREALVPLHVGVYLNRETPAPMGRLVYFLHLPGGSLPDSLL